MCTLSKTRHWSGLSTEQTRALVFGQWLCSTEAVSYIQFPTNTKWSSYTTAHVPSGDSKAEPKKNLFIFIFYMCWWANFLAHRSADPLVRLPLLQMASTPLLAWQSCALVAEFNLKSCRNLARVRAVLFDNGLVRGKFLLRKQLTWSVWSDSRLHLDFSLL